MKTSKLLYLLCGGLALIVVMGCNLASNVATQPTTTSDKPAPTPVAAIQTPNEPTATAELQFEATPTSAQPPEDTQASPTSMMKESPECTVLQELNFRSGPGTAYQPPIRSLPADTKLVPLGYNPEGIPSGTWVQVKEESNNQIGWVSAGAKFVSCNIDLTSLPSVAVGPPPPPPLPEVGNSAVDGDNIDAFVGKVIFSPDSLVQIRVRRQGDEYKKNGDGIAQVVFTVADLNSPFTFTSTERNPAFCIFGGGEPDCNTWVLEDFVYKWGRDGEVLKSGTYNLLIEVTAEDGTIGKWFVDELIIQVPK